MKVIQPEKLLLFKAIILSVLLLSLFGCSKLKKSNAAQGEQLARVYDKVLLRDELLEEMPEKLSPRDSADFVNDYIKNWTMQQVFLHHAENNLTDEQLDVEKALEKYRNTLVSYAFEKEFVHQHLDTIVADADIEQYYNQNTKNFELKDNIIKVIYVKLKKKAPKIQRVKEWYKSDRPQDRKLLEDYCRQFADNYFLDDQSWLLFDDLLKEIPIETYDKEQYLKNNRLIELEDQDFFYLVNIKGFKIKDALSPLSFERENIRHIILNKRKIKLIETMKQDIYNDALNHREIEIMHDVK